MGKELILPKNIRQIGDIQGKEKIFLEDYVMTYIKKKEKQEKEGYLGIFLGERQEKEDAVYVFIRGILEVPANMLNPQEETEIKDNGKESLKKIRKDDEISEGSNERDDSERNAVSKGAKEENWMEIMEKEYQEYFPDLTVQGCCVIGLYPTERMRLLSESLPEAGGLIYHLQEQEETIYRVENGRYRQIKGYFVFYEQNRSMQEYMANVFSHDSVEKEGTSDNAIRNFRKKVKEKGLQKNTSFLKLASSFFVVTVLVIGAIVVNRIDDIRSVKDTVSSGDTTVENEIVVVEDTAEGQDVISDYPGADQVVANDAGGSYTVETNAAAVASSSASNLSISSSLMDSEITQELAGSDAFWSDASLEDAGSVSDEADAVQEAAQSIQEDVDQENVQSIQSDAVEEAIQSTQTEIAQDTVQTEAAQEAASIRQLQAAYVIKEGDTLADICNRYYGSLDRLTEICEANEITDANMIMPGQKIVLP